MLSNAPGPPPPASGPPPTAEGRAAAVRRATAYDEAATDLKNATAQFQDAVNGYHDAAGKAARAIRDEIDGDGLKDSWWDRNFGWISKVFMVVGIVVIVLAVVALILICPLSAAFIAGLLGAELATVTTISAALAWIILGLTVTQGLGDGLGQVGKLLPGIDGLLPRLLEPLAEGAEDAAKAVSAGRAGRAFMSREGLPGVLYSLGSRSGLIATVMDWAGQGGKLAGAIDAANAARETVETMVKGAKPGNMLSLFAMSSDEATVWAKLSALGDKVPGVVRIVVPQAIAGTAIALEGGAQWASFIGGNTYQISSWVQGDDSAAVNQTIGDFRQMISHVPAP